MTTITWLHLSDWHQIGKELDREVVRDALIQDIKGRERINSDLGKIDFVVFSGDVAYSGKTEQYTAAREHLFEPLLEATQVDKQHLVLVPGNHDIDWDRFDLLPAPVSQPFTTERQAKEWLECSERRKALLEPFKAYSEFAESYDYQEQAAYRTLKKISTGEATVALLGLNSAMMCGRRHGETAEDNDRGYLVIGEHQIYEALQEMRDTDVRIAVHHHPHDYLTGFDRIRIRRRLLENCDFILHGHEHRPGVEKVESADGTCIIVPSGASYTERVASDPRYQLAYNFVHLDLSSRRSVVYLRRWSDTRGEFIQDNDTHSLGQYTLTLAHRDKNFSSAHSRSKSAPCRVTGTAFDKTGHPKEGVKVKIVVDTNTFVDTTNDVGHFDVEISHGKAEVVKMVAATVNEVPLLSAIKELSWHDAIGEEVTLTLEQEPTLYGEVVWCGSREPIPDAYISVELPGGEVRRIRSSVLGTFSLELPNHYRYTLHIETKGALESSLEVEVDGEMSVEFKIARSCEDAVHETVLVHRVCDDIEIDFVLVPEGDFFMGPPNSTSEVQLDGFWIARYPVTYLQYSFYLQHNPEVALPMGWMNRFPVAGKEHHPVVSVTWYEALHFCEWISELVGHMFRLPSEAQWEKAARGVDQRVYPWGDDHSQRLEACNCGENGRNVTTPVDSYSLGRSPFGAWDMIGNVWEWTGSLADDPMQINGKNADAFRIARGGSFLDLEENTKCFSQGTFDSSTRLPQLGFRITREV